MNSAMWRDQSGSYDHFIVDEAQDISVGELRFLARIAPLHENGLFLPVIWGSEFSATILMESTRC